METNVLRLYAKIFFILKNDSPKTIGDFMVFSTIITGLILFFSLPILIPKLHQ